METFSRGRQKREEKEGRDSERLTTSSNIWSPLPRAKARVNKSAELSSARINNVLLCLEFPQSVLLTHFGKTYWLYPCDKYRNHDWVVKLCEALATRPSSRGRGWQRRSAHPPRQWDQPQMWKQQESPKKDIKSEKVVTKTKSRFLAKPREIEGF